MQPGEMLSSMCRTELTETDIKAIRKHRGFSVRDTSSRALLESLFLSDVGVAEALSDLTKKEITVLLMLGQAEEPPDVKVFDPVYGKRSSSSHYQTFSRQYQNVFKQVKERLVQRGVLLMKAAEPTYDTKSKLELWRFAFPKEFEPFLPTLFNLTRRFEGVGNVRSEPCRDKLKGLVNGRKTKDDPTGEEFRLSLRDGEMCLGNAAFGAAGMQRWLLACWAKSFPGQKRSSKGEEVATARAVLGLLSPLGEHQWIEPAQLSEPLEVLFEEKVEVQHICEAGWKWGLLARITSEGQTCYRPAPDGEVEASPAGLSVDASGALVVNLETISLHTLGALAPLSQFTLVDKNAAALAAKPSFVKIGRNLPRIREQPLSRWLCDNVPTYQTTFKTVEERWGKQILHENLKIARIADLELKVRLQRLFPDRLVFLSDEFAGFPQDLWEEMEKAINKWGYVTKRVENDA